MNTEITDVSEVRGVLFYDADCRFCSRLARRVRPFLARRDFRLLPLQTPGCQEKLGRTHEELQREMWLLMPDGHSLGGADALLEISRHFFWTWPVRLAAKVPLVLEFLRAAYYWIARHRNCVGGACAVQKPVMPPVGRATFRSVDAVPLLLLPLVVLGFRPEMPAWVFMWAMALAIYAGGKWLTYREALRHGIDPAGGRAAAYLLAWPGMGAKDFLDRKVLPTTPRKSDWVVAGGKAMLGVILVWGIARMTWPAQALLTGWIGMLGVTLALHFGSFQLLALAWQKAGVMAVPLMDKPTMAHSLAEFWGRRWNTAFNELAFRFTFRPLLRATSASIALVIVFALSGLVHELVISVPARGGYGLPTAYFLAQGLGMLAERSRIGRNIGLGRGAAGRLFTILITAGPAFWLFHPPFIKNVILPMLTAIGAI